jgi:hypothetical protein
MAMNRITKQRTAPAIVTAIVLNSNSDFESDEGSDRVFDDKLGGGAQR